jgi:SPX domain protein involved in polyphosphate accumulation
MEAIRKFNRFELKYLLTIKEANELKEQIKPYLFPDPYSWKAGEYVITSLYYDTSDFKCYWEKIDGIKFRKKLRIRFYETENPLTEDSLVFVEVKQRYDKTIQKRRVEMKYKDALTLCNERIIPEHEERDTPVIEEILSMVEERNLQPTLITSYFRHAYVGTDYDLGLRITFDSSLKYRREDLDLTSKNPGRYIISPYQVILEIKTNERVPYWLTELIAQNNYRLMRMSKYCIALEMDNEFPKWIEAY